MKNATLIKPERLNEFEVILVAHHMEQNYPGRLYTMAPGNDCIWVSCGRVECYYIFRDGKIAEIQFD